MATALNTSGPADLQAGAHYRWHSWRHATLHVQRGRVWVTASDRLDDHFVDAGAALELPAGARVLIGAESAARVSVERAGWFSAPSSAAARASAPRSHPAPHRCPATA